MHAAIVMQLAEAYGFADGQSFESPQTQRAHQLIGEGRGSGLFE
jgi:hypothetical protein